MATRAQLHRRRSLLARAWDLHIPAICDKRPTNAERAGVRTEIVASWERSASHITPEGREAPVADVDQTRLAWETSPLSAPVRQLESQLPAAADDGELVVAATQPRARTPGGHGAGRVGGTRGGRDGRGGPSAERGESRRRAARAQAARPGQRAAERRAAAAHQAAARDPRAAGTESRRA